MTAPLYSVEYHFPIMERVFIGRPEPNFEIDINPMRLIRFALTSDWTGKPCGYLCRDCQRANLPEVFIPVTENSNWQELIAVHGRLHADMLQWARMVLRD